MTRKQKIVAAITVVLGLGLLLAPFIPAWLFWRRIHQFEQVTGVSDAWYFHEPGDGLGPGTDVGIRYSGNPAFRDFLGGTLSGLSARVEAVSITHLNCEKLNALRFVNETRMLRLVAPAGSSCPAFTSPPFDRLEFLSLEGAGLGDAVLNQLAAGGKLRSLYLHNENAISNEALHHALKNNELVDLSLRYVPGFDGQFPEAAETLSGLQSVTLSGDQFGDAAAAQLAEIDSLVDVQFLDAALTDEGVSRLAQCQTVRSMLISDCSITDISIDYFITMPNLELLSLRADISDEAIEQFRTARPNCKLAAGRPLSE
jgi:hypothetical protein